MCDWQILKTYNNTVRKSQIEKLDNLVKDLHSRWFPIPIFSPKTTGLESGCVIEFAASNAEA